MTRLLISTTSRHKLASQPSGHFYVVDVENKIIIQRSEIIEPPYREFDTNPRGGVRGVKGISVREDLIALSNSSRVFLYDPNWKPIMSWGHPSCAGIHDIELQDECLWITSARNDLLFKIDLRGNLLYSKNVRSLSPIFKTFKWRPTPGLSQNQISNGKIDFRDPRSHDPNKSDAAHINSITILPDGELLVSLGLLINQNFSRLLTIKKWLIDIGLWKKLLRINRSIRKKFSMKKNMHSDLVIQPASANSAVIRITKGNEFVPCISFSGVTVPSHTVRSLNRWHCGLFEHNQWRSFAFPPYFRQDFFHHHRWRKIPARCLSTTR